ncbi:MAG: lysylphosphatidylglycerol synthase transmembrane domain-containing protein [Kiloniellales bacterium]|nr:lysylphosphatidylglycerol synthase transmembrane domain-containing protein [Kiloniellales bacterium]
MPKKLLFLAAKIAVTAGLLHLVFRDLSLTEIAALLQDFSVGPLVLAAALILAQAVVVVAWRWSRILSAIDRPVAARELWSPVVIGVFFNQVLPSTVGGDGMRMWFLTRMGRPFGLAVRSVLIDRILGLLALMALSAGGALFLIPFVATPAPLWGVAAVSLTGTAAVVAAPTLLHLLGFLPIDAVKRQIGVVAAEITVLRRRGGLMLGLFGVSVVGHLLLALAACAVAACLNLEIPLFGALAVLPAVMLAATLPVSIAGWGVREGAMVLGLGLIGVEAGPAALISVSFGLLQLGLGMLGGLVWLVHGRPKPADLAT